MARVITEVSRDVYQAFVGVPTVRDTPLGEAVFLVTPPLSELQISKKSDNRQAATKKAIRNKPPPEKAGSFSRFSVINHVSCISMCGTRGCRTPVPNLHTQSPSGFTRVFWPARLRSKALPSQLVPQLRIPIIRVGKVLNYNLLHLTQSRYDARTIALNIKLYYSKTPRSTFVRGMEMGTEKIWSCSVFATVRYPGFYG